MGNYAINLTGGTQYVNLGTQNLSGGAYSISFWVKGTTGEFMNCGYNSSSELIWEYAGQVSTYTSSLDYSSNLTFTETAGQWNHCVLTVNGSTAKLYFNGGSATTVTDWRTVASATLYLGLRPRNTTYGTGSFDELAVWGRTLTAGEAGDLYASGSGLYIDPTKNFASSSTPISTNLQGLWHFDEGTGTTAYAAGYGSNGTLYNSAGWVAGKVLAPGGQMTTNSKFW